MPPIEPYRFRRSQPSGPRRRPRLRPLAGVVSATLWGLVPGALADDIQVNTYTLGLQAGQAVAASPDGDFVVVWFTASGGSSGNDSSGYGVEAQRFASTGARLGLQFQVNEHTTGSQLSPRVAIGPAGDFVVVWQSEGVGNDLDDGIASRRFASDGSLIASEFQVNLWTTGGQAYPAVAIADDGGFAVVWQSEGSVGDDTSLSSVQLRRFASDGAPRGGQVQVNSYVTNDQGFPVLAMNGAGAFVVVWHSQGSAGDDSSSLSVQAQLYDADGVRVGGELQVNDFTNSYQHYPAVAMAENGDFAVVWESYGSPFDDGSLTSVQAQRFHSAGSAVGGQIQLNTYTDDRQNNPDIALLPSGGFVTTWDSRGSGGNDTSSTSIQLQRFSSDGVPVSGEMQINTYTTEEQIVPRIAAVGSESWVVVWASNGSAFDDSSSRSIQIALPTIFADGFESGDTSAWSLSLP